MQKTKRSKFVVVAIVIFSMVAMYGFMPTVNAASMQAASITLGDSAPSATATSTVSFNLVTTLPAGGYVEVDLSATDFGVIATSSIDCGTGGVASTTGTVVTCSYAGGLDTSEHEFEIQLTNAAAGEKNGTITAYTSADVEIETTQVAMYVISAVTVSATVNATLTFALSGTTTGAVVNGATTTVDTSGDATAIPFGTLTDGNQKTAGQDITVATNATNGYTVTVVQNQDMTSGAGATIDAFIDGTPDAGSPWQGPAGTLGAPGTYGHMGLTADDAGLSTLAYVGLTTGTVQTVMSHTGVADGISSGVGYASVAYSVEISALQEAGDYNSTLTYVCTPSY